MDRAPSDLSTGSRRTPVGDELASPAPDDLPACLSCRRRKSKCSRERPSCMQCSKIGAECQYVVKQKPGIKAGAVDSLGRRIEVLEQILLDGEGNTKAKLAAFLEGHGTQNGDASGPSASGSFYPPHRAGPLPPIWDHPRQRPPPLRDDAFGLTANDPEEHRRKRRRTDHDDDNDDHDDDDAWMPPLPSFPLLEAVVEAHFHTVHHWIPILHEMRFRAKLKDPAQRTRLAVLLHALLSAAIKYVDCSKFGMTAADVTRQIRTSRRAVMMHAMESLSIENSQALIVLAFDYIGSGNVSKAWPVIGSLTRIVDYLQLTVEPNEDSPKQPLLRSLAILEKPQDWTESEERRRLFWTVFLLDRICSVTSGWHTSLTSDDVRRRLPCGGAMWARSEPVSTPFFGIWDKSTAKIGNSISNAPALYQSPKAVSRSVPNNVPNVSGDPDTSKLGAFAYCIEATENLSQVTSFFLRQGVDFADRQEVKDWLTRFKELDLRLVHWKMFLPRQWQDSNVSRDILVIKMDPNLTLAHISHNACMILLHQHIAYPPTRWRDVVKLPSACSAETCHLAAVETASIVHKYLRYMGGIVNAQFAFCAFVAAKVLLVHWRSGSAASQSQAQPSHPLAPEFSSLQHSLESMSDKWLGYHSAKNTCSSSSSSTAPSAGFVVGGDAVDLAGGYAAQLRQWHAQCLRDVTNPADILGDAMYYCLRGKEATTTTTTTTVSVSGLLSSSQQHQHQQQHHMGHGGDRRCSSGFEAYQSAGVPSPAQASDGHSALSSHLSPPHVRLPPAYELHSGRHIPEAASPQSQGAGVAQSPMAVAGTSQASLHVGNGNMMAASEPQQGSMLDGMGAASTNGYPRGQGGVLEEDELTAMSHMLLGHQFLEMDRVITLQGTDFFTFESSGRPGLSG